jgi:hypothetical protein
MCSREIWAARRFHIANVTAKTLSPITVKCASRLEYLMSDDARVYASITNESTVKNPA